MICTMNVKKNNNYLTSYSAAHKLIPNVPFESNVSSLDPGIESKPNIPELKQWNYDTSTNVHHGFKINAMDPIQKSTKLNVNQTLYMMPQFEKYLSNPPKLMYIPPTEYNDNYLQPKLMSNIEQLPATMICGQTTPVAQKLLDTMETLKVSDAGAIRKVDPYVSTQKLDYIEINPDTAKQLNSKHSKLKHIKPAYEPFYDEPIFNRHNTIRLLPNTLKHVPHNALISEMRASYKIPFHTSTLVNTVEMPISISRNLTLSQLLSVPGMYTSEYSKIGGH
ncbi:uncharacterized protein LOC132923440 isoform X2 [Rhopalosiphum padi]|uniref:uncharacterized protein LOC132923440 isoform X2 n=1 Tax=Rhopalosiphum padi TaxID=40932 RepID=UPI00298E1C57|nr:uncharacterized protein LOC132923440 isoform X2 [Rhopalosiphum padi]